MSMFYVACPHLLVSRLARPRTPGPTWMPTQVSSSLTTASLRCSTTLSSSVSLVPLVLLLSSSGIVPSVLVSPFLESFQCLSLTIIVALERPKSYSTAAIQKMFKDKS
jgi:hypothetical protein